VWGVAVVSLRVVTTRPAITRWREKTSAEIFDEAERLDKRAARLRSLADAVFAQELERSCVSRRKV